ncbi:MAG: DNA polymerase III subunit gamma/tau [Anaerolineales bacterium]|nr:DNA polymerase III subunit gamma/tau [Anaerolineales bacterium]MCB8950720.1 DNA polymerase III subunit gamma/tau [Ardenticatenales bacterium]
MSQALYRKWRPARFDEVVGQEHVTRTLQNGVASDRVGHAFLFSGPRGTGKTTTARLLAKAVNCRHSDPAQRPCNTCHICRAVNEGRFLDLIEIDAASNTGVDDIRDLRDKINFSPNEGRFKVYIIDEVHMLSTAAFNALLKTLEEPPPHAKFVLATTEEHKVPATIKSRCQVFHFRLLTVSELTARLLWLAEKENLTIEPEALALIARQGAGSARDAESLLDQLVTAPGDTITLARAQKVLGTASLAMVSQLTEAWLSGDGTLGLQLIHDALAAGADTRQLARQMVAYLRAVLLLQASGETFDLEMPADTQQQMRAQAEKAARPALITAIKQYNEVASTVASGWQPQLPLELAFIEMLPEVGGPVARRAQPAAIPQPARPSPSPLTSQPEPASLPATETVPEPPARTEAAATPPPAPPATASPPAAASLTLVAITSHWPQAMTNVKKKNRNLGSLLTMCQPLAVENGTLILGFEYGTLKDKFDNTAQARDLVGDALSELTGVPCPIRTVLNSQYRPPAQVSKAEFDALAEELGGVVREIE